jgi:hypothetical protein
MLQLSSITSAITIDSSGLPRPRTTTMEDAFTLLDGRHTYFIGLAPSPISVKHDPAKGPWEKTLFGVPPQRDEHVTFVARRGHILDITEHLKVDGTSAWSDWHERVLTPEWNWGGVSDFLILDPNTGNFVGAPGATVTLSPSRTLLSFNFDAIPPGARVRITKQLVFMGDRFSGTVKVEEFPTIRFAPEPSTVMLLCSSALALTACCRRRRKRVARQPRSSAHHGHHRHERAAALVQITRLSDESDPAIRRAAIKTWESSDGREC